MISKLHKDIIFLLNEIFPAHTFLYEYPYSKFVTNKTEDPFLITVSKRLHADIYDKTLNICYEIQGIQHYKAVDFFGGVNSFFRQEIIDRYKRRILFECGVTLVEIPYTFKPTKEGLMELINNRSRL